MAPDLSRSGGWIGLGGMASVAFLYGWSALVVPGWLTSLVLPLVWLVLFGLACAWFVRHPYRALVLPVLATGAWFVVLLG